MLEEASENDDFDIDKIDKIEYTLFLFISFYFQSIIIKSA